MKVIHLFLPCTDEQFYQLMKECKGESNLKEFLCSKLSVIIAKEVERIKEEDFKSIDILGKETKL